MTSRSDFSDDDWKQLVSIVIIASAVISAADDVGQGDDSEMEEMQAFRDSLGKLAGKFKFKKIELVQDVAAALESEDTDEVWMSLGTMGAAVSHENPLVDQLETVRAGIEIVDRVADKKEAKAFKNFIFDAARAVASASKESFFALASPISKKDEYYLRQLRSVLGL